MSREIWDTFTLNLENLELLYMTAQDLPQSVHSKLEISHSDN